MRSAGPTPAQEGRRSGGLDVFQERVVHERVEKTRTAKVWRELRRMKTLHLFFPSIPYPKGRLEAPKALMRVSECLSVPKFAHFVPGTLSLLLLRGAV